MDIRLIRGSFFFFIFFLYVRQTIANIDWTQPEDKQATTWNKTVINQTKPDVMIMPFSIAKVYLPTQWHFCELNRPRD